MATLPSLDEVTGEEINDLMTDVEVETPSGKVESLAQVGVDIVDAHDELEQYKNGALAMVQALDETIIEYENAGNAEAVAALEEVRHAAYGVYLRLSRGDEEVLGDRNGDYNGYFEGSSGDGDE